MGASRGTRSSKFPKQKCFIQFSGLSYYIIERDIWVKVRGQEKNEERKRLWENDRETDRFERKILTWRLGSAIRKDLPSHIVKRVREKEITQREILTWRLGPAIRKDIYQDLE